MAFAVAAGEASDYARHLISSLPADRSAGDLIRSARRLRILDLCVIDRAVIAERLAGASWEQIADALSLPVDETRRRHESACALWADTLDGPDRPWAEGAVGTLDDAHLDTTASAVDVWFARHAEPWDDAPASPVTRAARAHQ